VPAAVRDLARPGDEAENRARGPRGVRPRRNRRGGPGAPRGSPEGRRLGSHSRDPGALAEEGASPRSRQALPRGQPDARTSGLSPRHHVSRDHPDASPRDLRGGMSPPEGRRRCPAGNHDPVGRPLGGVAGRAGGARSGGEERHGAGGVSVAYKFGTMIEIPRAALVADEIARHAEFFSFGTNDLTQTTMGYSRDDAEAKFLLDYIEEGILPNNPFQTIDREGVGQPMRLSVQRGRKVRPNLEIG